MANAVLADLAKGDVMLPVNLHVTCFDRAGWKGGYSFPGASQRQRRYAAQLGTPGVYTPEVASRLEHDPAGVRVSAGAVAGGL